MSRRPTVTACPHAKTRLTGREGDGTHKGHAAGFPSFQRAVTLTRLEIDCSHSWPRLQRHHTTRPALAETVSGVTLTGLRTVCH